jgi:large subunit ribosomal protein L10
MSIENQQQKQLLIDEIKGKLDKASSAVLVDYIGLTVAQADAMRKKLREANVDYKIYKNTMLNRAIDGTAHEPLKEVLSGPSALAVSYDDVTAPARIIESAIKEYKKMSFKAGIIEGTFYDAEGIQAIATIPSREGLIAKFLGSIQNPIGSFVRVLAAIADSNSDGAAAEATLAEEPVAETAEAPVAVAETEAAEAPAEAVAPETAAEEAAPETVEAAPEEPAETTPAEETAEVAASEEPAAE